MIESPERPRPHSASPGTNTGNKSRSRTKTSLGPNAPLQAHFKNRLANPDEFNLFGSRQNQFHGISHGQTPTSSARNDYEWLHPCSSRSKYSRENDYMRSDSQLSSS